MAKGGRKTPALRELELAAQFQRYALGARIVDALKWVTIVFLVVWGARGVASSLAGRDTNVAAGFSVAVTASFVLTGVSALLVAQVRRQKGELKRLRQRTTTLERLLRDAGMEIPGEVGES
jgi:hypothetical protein